MIKLVHCADLHIGASFSQLPSALASLRREELRDAFSGIIGYCKEKGADALLICGDLFDSPTPIKKDADFVRNLLTSLSPIPVFIVCGNHDYMRPDSIFAKDGFFSDNVHIFPCFDYSFDIPEKNCTIYGKSYGSSITEPTFESLCPDESKINIMCLHGDLVPSSDYNAISHGTLSALPISYAAFGHIHCGEIFSVGNVKCAYSATPEAHSFSDDGTTGFIYAEISKNETTLFPVSLSKRHYHNLSFDITKKDSDAILTSLKKIIKESDLYRITLTGECSEEINIEYLKNELSPLAFYLDIFDNSRPSYDFDTIEKEESLRGEFLRELRKLCVSEEEFVTCAKAGLDALLGIVPDAEAEL